jgi:adenylate cyclase, class 2
VIEAELKALVRDADALRAALEARAAATRATYCDTYYDTPGHDLRGSGRELRVRVIDGGGPAQALLTYKEPAVAGTASKPEHETTVAGPAVLATLFAGLGLQVLVELTKHCTNYRLQHAGRAMLASVVTVPELPDTFVEVETLVPTAGEVPAALAAVRALLAEVGIGVADLDTRAYTDMVAAARAAGRAAGSGRSGAQAGRQPRRRHAGDVRALR